MSTQPHTMNTEAVDSFAPTRVLEIELSQPLPALAATDAATGTRYTRAHTLLRLHTIPVGLVMLAVPDAGLDAAGVAAQVWAAASDQINAHLQDDGLPTVKQLPVDGLPHAAEPACLVARRRFLEDKPPFMSIVVCTRDRAQQIPTALDSLLALDYPSYEIVLVDNAPSSEATADLVRVKYNTPKLRYIREHLAGISRARNRGIRESRGEFIAFTDDDVRVDRHWLTEIARAYQSAPDVASVSGLTMPAELDTEAQYYFEKFNSFTNGVNGFRHNAVNAPVAHPFYPINMAPFGAGVNVSYRRSLLQKVRGFRMTLGAGTPAANSEDIELYIRVTLQGRDMVYCPTALIWHYHRRNYDALQKQVYSYGVGQFPYLWYCIINQPSQLWNFIKRVPTVIRAVFSSDAPRNAKKTGYYPDDLRQRERQGIWYGPIAMLRSLWYAFRERPVVDLGTPPANQE